MASIEGISRITQIKEKEEDDQHRKIEEQKTDENNKRLNNILLILTIAQVWSGLVDIFEYKDEDCWKLYLNLVVYLIFLVFIVSNIKNKSIKK
jgi:succinate dehydrogenase hydrophobic anchor subunit